LTALFALTQSAHAQAETSPAPAAAEETSFVKDGVLDLDAVVEYFEDLYRSTSSIARAELVITKPRKTKRLELRMWTEGEEKALIVIEAPVREKGTATLKIDDNLWHYFPKINRTIRIPPSMMLSSWMGSDFTNDDVVRDSSYRNDYTYELTGVSESPPGWGIRFVAKPGIVGLWNRFDVVMSEDGRLPQKAEYYDRKDRLARTITWSDVKVFDGRRIPAHMTLVPADEEGQMTEFIYHDIDYDVALRADTFSLSNLERKR
jgi:outer membrane lipoprotein-sorting protein